MAPQGKVSSDMWLKMARNFDNVKQNCRTRRSKSPVIVTKKMPIS